MILCCKKSSGDPIANAIYKLKPFYQLCVILCGAILIHLTLGTFITFGNMLPYMASYMRNHTDPNIRSEDMMWIPTFQGSFPFSMLIGGITSTKFGPRISAFIGCFLVTLSVALSAYTIQHSFFAFFVSYGIIFGIGNGIAYVSSVSAAINWAPEKVGIVSGIVSAGFGLSSSIFAPIQTWLVNPKNLAPIEEGYFEEAELLERVPGVFIKLAIIYGIMQLIALIVVCDPPFRRSASNESLTDENDSEDGNNPFNENSEDVPPQLTSLEMLKSSTFYCLFLTCFCSSFYANMYWNLYKVYAESFIQDDFFIAMAFSISSIANAIARICWGILTDRTSFQTAFSISTWVATLFIITMPFVQLDKYFDFGKNTVELAKYVYLIWLCVTFICLAATRALFINAIVKCFGTKHQAKNYGILTLASTISGLVLSGISQFFLKMIGFTYLFMITAIFPFVAFVTISFIQKTPQGNRIV
ncbi:unnamed protein product [Caenorhabditis angaria]|uniref:Major facilitator superfamily (MFS) profile domain-containing protein n=1 Tax=Caenorhabditis angaria TaxID=860376 RepID=A0A9P1J0J9_9PELO|nr:unnamed protein product [Caenorhabditis angaria]